MINKVKAKWVIKNQPYYKLEVKTGDKVKAGQQLASGGEVEKNLIDITKFYSDGGRILEKIKSEWMGKEIKVGDVLHEMGFWVKKKIISPVSGVFTGVDEFSNIIVESSTRDVKKVVSPVDGTVVKADAEKIAIEFRAMEFSGVALTEGKRWCAGIKKIDKLPDINGECVGKIILIDKSEKVWLTKAEVVGVGGVIMTQNDLEDGIESPLPVIGLTSKLSEEILSIDQITNRNVLINANIGRVLVV